MQRITGFFSRDKRHLATAALIVGFAVDIVTFRNLNLGLSALILAVHLAIVAGTTLVIVGTREERAGALLARMRAWLPVLQQYSMGNLLSAFLVLYSASGSLVASWPFFVLVALAALGNEVIRDESRRFPFTSALLFLNVVLSMVLVVPLLVGAMGTVQFLIALVLAWVIFSSYLWLGRLVVRASFRSQWLLLRGTSLGIVALILFLYFTNVIPPIPLSVKDAGFYHTVLKAGDVYVARDETRPWFERFLDFQGIVLHLAPGEPAYFYSAVFAPARLDTEVVHHWERLGSSGAWVTTNIVKFPIIGGRQGGYRGYSLADAPAPGRWRVSVETARGAVIGRSYLVVERAPRELSLSEVRL